MSKILVCMPINPQMNAALKKRAIETAQKMVGANPLHEIGFLFDYRPISSLPSDYTPWSKVTRARNAILDSIRVDAYDYLLWIDADVIEHPPDMPSRLIAANPDGVTAPLDLIEGSDRFHDWAAFIMLGKSHIEPDNRWRLYGRNLQHEFPYWLDENHKPVRPEGVNIEMDCVGTVTLVSTAIYKDGTRYEDHPAFTDHFSICAAARRMGRKVICATDVVCLHADLPRWGEKWH